MQRNLTPSTLQLQGQGGAPLSLEDVDATSDDCPHEPVATAYLEDLIARSKAKPALSGARFAFARRIWQHLNQTAAGPPDFR